MSDAYKTPFKLPGLDSYPGGKGGDGTRQFIINQIPEHDIYIEPFLGGGAIMRHKRPAPVQNIGIELDPEVVNVWRCALQHITLLHENAFSYLHDMALAEITNSDQRHRQFLFIDPPYLDATLSNRRAPYRHRLPYEAHVELLNRLKTIGQMPNTFIMVCALPNLLYEHMLQNWRSLQYWNKTRSGMQREQIWMNYGPPEKLHDYRYLGDDFHARYTIKRRRRDLLKKVASLTAHEAQAFKHELNLLIP